MSKFDVRDEALTNALTYIDALEARIAKLERVRDAAQAFYLNHEHLGWGGHEAIGAALAACDDGEGT